MIKLSAIAPSQLVSSCDILIDPLEKAVNKKPKEGIVGFEAERAIELIKSTVRVISTISRLEEINNNRNWQEFSDRLGRSGINLILI